MQQRFFYCCSLSHENFEIKHGSNINNNNMTTTRKITKNSYSTIIYMNLMGEKSKIEEKPNPPQKPNKTTSYFYAFFSSSSALTDQAAICDGFSV